MKIEFSRLNKNFEIESSPPQLPSQFLSREREETTNKCLLKITEMNTHDKSQKIE